MVKSKTKKRCKAINRLPVDMLYDGRNSTRNLHWIHRNYVRHLFDVTQERFHPISTSKTNRSTV
ncbi:hypothetical protein D1647_11600 [Alistipes sp. Z76]|nr:hypothetical protein [Alistipes sp. Z76]NCE68906.1 hypothetical protein [Muribaculaceae bacterium M3]